MLHQILAFVPFLSAKFTDIRPIYAILVVRFLLCRLIMSLNYILVDKYRIFNIPQKQVIREGNSYCFGILLHANVQILLQIVFPNMFLAENPDYVKLVIAVFLSHVFVTELIYYAFHYALHTKYLYEKMHYFHHMSKVTVPSTSLVQDKIEHLFYVAVFSPSFLVPYFVMGYNHWTIIGLYLVMFDLFNAYGHVNISVPSIMNNFLLRYFIYTPEFHIGHHNLFKVNYGLFMPIYDHIFGTFKYTEFIKDGNKAAHPVFAFIGHPGNLGHLLTLPEYNFYNIYNNYNTSLPLQLDMMIADMVIRMYRTVVSMQYSSPYYKIGSDYIGNVISLAYSPLDYFKKSKYNKINEEIFQVIKREYAKGTVYFGLGNLNKTKFLNDGGVSILERIKASELRDQVYLWTGDTMTVATIYKQILSLKIKSDVFYIGGIGKIGKVLCHLLKDADYRVCIYTQATTIPYEDYGKNVYFTTNIDDITKYDYVINGKNFSLDKVQGAVTARKSVILDYTVPFYPINKNHYQLATLTCVDKSKLQGPYDICFDLKQYNIYPCHAGCIINVLRNHTKNEVGEIDISEINEDYFKMIEFHGFKINDVVVNRED